MNRHRLARLAAMTTAVAVAVVSAAGAPASTTSAATPKITAAGAGKVKIGKRYTTLRRQQLIGKIRPGCELGGPNTRSAALRLPLRGSVDFTQTAPRKVTNLTITRGATARGVGIGGTIADIQAAYPKAKVDHGTDDVFGVTLVKIPRSDGGRLQFAVDTNSGEVTAIGVPYIAFCE